MSLIGLLLACFLIMRICEDRKVGKSSIAILLGRIESCFSYILLFKMARIKFLVYDFNTKAEAGLRIRITLVRIQSATLVVRTILD